MPQFSTATTIVAIFDRLLHKTYHGVKDLVKHLFLTKYDREKNRQAAYADIKNDQCLKCHRNIIYMPDKRGAMLAHRSVIYPRPGYDKSCFDCHRNLVHNDRTVYEYKQNPNYY